jgi:hypothetical protein
MFMNIGFNLIPVSLVVPDLFAVGANRDHAAQGFDLIQGFLQPADQAFFSNLAVEAVVILVPWAFFSYTAAREDFNDSEPA